MEASKDPIVFRSRWRPWWPRVAGFLVFIVAALLVTAEKGTLEIADLFIGAAFVIVFGAFFWWITDRINTRLRITFDGWLMTISPAIGRTRTLDVREIGKVRLMNHRGYWSYQCSTRGSGWRGRHYYVPVTLMGYEGPAEALLARLATVEDLDADERTEESLGKWRGWLEATGTDPTNVPLRSPGDESIVPAPYGPEAAPQ